MKNIDQLKENARKLKSDGLLAGQIADELNVSRETVVWLLTHSAKTETGTAPKDIYVNWSAVGSSPYRLGHIASALTDLIAEELERTGANVDVVVGIALSGVPLAILVANELGCEFAIFHPNKQQWDTNSEGANGAFSHNFAKVVGKNCVVVDDVITTGTAIIETVSQLQKYDAKSIAIAVMVDKKGADTLSGVPVCSLMRIARLD